MDRATRRLLSLVPAARRSLLLSAGLSTAAAVLVVAQAGLLAGIVADAFPAAPGRPARPPPSPPSPAS